MPMPKDYASYHQRIAADHPELRFEVLNQLELDENTLEEDILVAGKFHKEDLFQELWKGKGIKGVQPIEEWGDVGVYRVTLETAPLARILKELRIMIHYPMPFTAATCQILVVAPGERIESLIRRVRTFAPGSTVDKVRNESLEGPQSVLTMRQSRLLRQAMSSGYWGIPRNTSVPALAGQMGETNAEVSEDLSEIEERLLKDADTDGYFALSGRGHGNPGFPPP